MALKGPALNEAVYTKFSAIIRPSVYFCVKVKVSVLFWIKNGTAHCDKGMNITK